MLQPTCSWGMQRGDEQRQQPRQAHLAPSIHHELINETLPSRLLFAPLDTALTLHQRASTVWQRPCVLMRSCNYERACIKAVSADYRWYPGARTPLSLLFDFWVDGWKRQTGDEEPLDLGEGVSNFTRRELSSLSLPSLPSPPLQGDPSLPASPETPSRLVGLCSNHNYCACHS